MWTQVILATFFTEKMPERSDSMYSFSSCLKIYDILLPEVDQIQAKLWSLFQFSLGPQGP